MNIQLMMRWGYETQPSNLPTIQKILFLKTKNFPPFGYEKNGTREKMGYEALLDPASEHCAPRSVMKLFLNPEGSKKGGEKDWKRGVQWQSKEPKGIKRAKPKSWPQPKDGKQFLKAGNSLLFQKNKTGQKAV